MSEFAIDMSNSNRSTGIVLFNIGAGDEGVKMLKAFLRRLNVDTKK